MSETLWALFSQSITQLFIKVYDVRATKTYWLLPYGKLQYNTQWVEVHVGHVPNWKLKVHLKQFYEKTLTPFIRAAGDQQKFSGSAEKVIPTLI